jgi:signal peptidase II
MRAALLTIFSVLVLDQVSKIWVKLSMFYGESIPVFGNWFYIHFIENPGMAFGMELGGNWGKLALSIFRILAVIGIAIYLYSIIKKKRSRLYIVAISLILTGALGNILDSAFYGLIFSDSSSFTKATFLSADGGYAPFLMGRVVDMLYFPLIDGHFPEWFPFWKGEYFQFFRPVFNVADVAISTGVGILLVFQKRIAL